MVYWNMKGRACKHAARAEVAVAMCYAGAAHTGDNLREASGVDDRIADRRACDGDVVQFIFGRAEADAPMWCRDRLIKNGSNLIAAGQRWRVRAPRRAGDGAARSDPRRAPASVAGDGDVNLGEFLIEGARGLEDSCCPQDLIRDGVADFADYIELLNFYDAADPSVDFNGTAGGFHRLP